ncbi:MFS transporter [Herbiconiux flava]|uniref:Putative MFS family arabinose efflux permease n=1 Tax=Herbiconiux flava TaxID=881268 RepID=A0A852SNJ1_9MICO|nr:MFS transporter [Herbiconiux flava]NYD70389.1 putative MFS family arabinose efflux permease [Herbiconiux flava]
MTTFLPQTGSIPVVKRFPWGGLIVLATAVFLSVTAEMIPTGLLPEMSTSLGVTESQTGLLISFFAFAVVLTSVPLSLLFRRVPRHLLLVGVLVVVAVTSVLASMAPSYEFLVVVRIIGGMAHGVFWGVVGAYSAHLVPKEQIGRAVALTTGGGTLAFVLGVPLATAVGHAFGWRIPFLAVGLLALLGAVLLWFMLPRVDHLKHAVQDARLTDSGRRRRFVWNDSIPAVALVCIFAAVVTVGHYSFYTYIAPFMIDRMGVAEGDVGLLLLVYGVAGALGLIIAGSVFGKRPSTGLLVSLAVTAASVLVLSVFTANPVIAIGSFALWGVVFGIIPTLMATRLMHVADPAIRDAASAFYSTAFNVGIGLGAVVGALFLDTFGLEVLPWVDLVAIVIGASLLLATPMITRRAARS